MASPGPTMSFAEPYREAHLESVSPRSAPSTVRASALERLGAHLAADENFGRKLSKDAARALNGVDYLTDREKHLLAGMDKRAWGALVEASDKFKVAVGKRAVAGVPAGLSQLGDYLNGFKFGGGAGAYGWGDLTTPGGPSITLASGKKVGGRTGRWSGAGSSLGGRDDGARGAGGVGPFGPGGRGPFGPDRGLPGGIGGDLSARGIDWDSPPDLSLPQRPAPKPFTEKDMTVHGDDYPRQFDPNVGKAWEGWQAKTTGEEANLAEKTRAQETLDREAAEQAALDEIFSPDSTATEAVPANAPNPRAVKPVRAGLLVEPPPPPPKPEGKNPNPDDPNGGGPVGPWSRTARSSMSASTREAMPNYEGTGGGGPVGPWSREGFRDGARGYYGPAGREAFPNYEGTGGGGPVGPRSRDAARVLGRYGDIVLPNPDDPNGPVGPTT